MGRKLILHIVDDNARQRAQLSHLAYNSGFHPEIYSSIDDLPADRLTGSLILLNVAPGLDESATFEERVQRCSGMRPTITYSLAAEPAQIVRAILAGALDFLVLSPVVPVAAGRLLACIDRVYARVSDRPSHVMREVDARRVVAPLSTRESEILDGIVEGHSNKDIARLLNISHRTVEKHRANVIVKMGVRNSAEAIRIGQYARR